MQTEGLVCAICYLGFLFQTPSGGVFAVPQQIAVLIGHFSWDADLVAVEVVGLLASFTFFVDPVVYLCQRLVAVGIGVDIGISAIRVDILTNVSLSLAIFFSWIFKSSYKLQIIVKFTWIFLIKCCIRIVI